MQVPDAIDPAIGYRVWLVRGSRLYSFARQNVLWVPHETFVATCDKSHEVPADNCRCGTYAAATFNRLFDMGYTKDDGLFAAPGEVTIAGQVALWGGIVPGQVGWRAQYAYPHKLLIPYTRWKLAIELSEAYGVPFKLYNLQRKHERGE